MTGVQTCALPIFSAIHLRVAAHQLEIVYNDHTDAVVAFEPARFGSRFEHVYARRIVDEDLSLGELAHFLREIEPVLLLQSTRPQLVQIQPRFDAQESLRQLHLGHLETEHSNRNSGLDGSVSGQAERQRGFSHTRARGQDQQVAILKTGGYLVDLGEDHICHHVAQLLNDDSLYSQMTQATSPYGDGTSAQQILAHIDDTLGARTSSPMATTSKSRLF